MPDDSKEEQRKLWMDFKGVQVMETWLDRNLKDVARGKGGGLFDRFKKDSNTPLDDLGVKVVMISGVPTQHLTKLIGFFREGLA